MDGLTAPAATPGKECACPCHITPGDLCEACCNGYQPAPPARGREERMTIRTWNGQEMVDVEWVPAADLDAARKELEAAKEEARIQSGYREGHPGMCCGQCHDTLASLRKELEAARERIRELEGKK